MSHLTFAHSSTTKTLHWPLLRRWILANALGEGLGLGATFAMGFLLFVQSEPLFDIYGMAIVAVLGGTLLEGLLVGTAQWIVLRRPLTRLSWHSWAFATALGAAIAWTLGMIPSTFLFTGTPDSATPSAPEISDALIYSLAFLMGLVLGPVLGTPQWLVLRHHLRNAVWWIPANALVWALGMVVIFIGTSFIPAEGIQVWTLPLLIMFLLLAGTTVGLLHGLVLLLLLNNNSSIAQQKRTD